MTYGVLGYLIIPRPMRTFRVTLSSGEMFTGSGTEIRGNGFCTDLLVDGVVTGRVCMPHMVSEIIVIPPTKEPVGKTIASR